jgi:hypothetical protein
MKTRCVAAWGGLVFLLGLSVLATRGAGAPEATGKGFTDVTAESGVADIVKKLCENVPKWWLSGMTLVDIDGDGKLDLHLGGHGFQAAAGVNDGKGHFTYVDPKLSIPRGKGKTDDIPFPGGEIRLVYDLNEDGKPDILASWGDGQGVIYLNDSKAGNPPAWNFKVKQLFDCFSRGTAMADMNRDGIVDYLGQENTKSLTVLLGKSDGTFGDPQKPIEAPSESGAIPVDINGDGCLDLLLSQRGYNPTARRVLLNDGKMSFTDVTVASGLDPGGGSIHGVGDVNQDGSLDLICVEGTDIVIYLNDGKGHFKKGEPVEGMEAARAKPHSTNWGGAVVTDFDNDGVPDIILNGRNFLYVLRGLGGGKFAYASNAWGLSSSMGSAVDENLCFGDIDGDGMLDLVTYGKGPDDKRAGVAVFRNDLAKKRWVNVRPVGLKGNRAAAGSKIRVYELGGINNPRRLLWFEQVSIWGRQSFHSYYFAAQTERHFGIGERTTVDVSIEFYPSGKKVEKRGVKTDATVEIREN